MGRKGLWLPPGDAQNTHGEDRAENPQFERGSDISHQPNSAHVHIGDDDNDQDCDRVVAPSNQLGKIKPKIVGEQHRVQRTQQERSAPVPPTRQKTPEITESSPRPAIKPAFNRHGGGELCRYQ